MNTYTTILFLLTIIGIFALARIALKYLRISHILRQICRHLIVINFRLRKKALRREQLRSRVLMETVVILSIACMTLVCALAFYCNI